MRTLILSALFLSFSLATMAGPKHRVIKGTVIDAGNDGLAGAKIEVKGTDIVVYSDFEGNFIIDRLKSGTYDISISLVSYQEVEISLPTVDVQSSKIKLQSR